MEEERAIRSAFRLLRSQRNDLAPISRLHPEILGLVFTALSDMDPPSLSDWKPKIGWRTVTHVCQRWRQNALDQSHLWARIQLHMGERWARTSLERARSSPLSFILHQSNQALHLSNQEVDMVDENLARTKSLQFYISPQNIRFEQLLLRSPAPMLESLDARFETEDSVYHRLPATFLGGHLPKLRHLHLAGWSFRWNSPILRRLKTLDLSYAHSRRESIQPVHLSKLKTIIAALQGMQQLERLSLHLVLPASTNTSARVELPNLTFLDLTGLMDDITAFLRHVSFPLNARVSLGLELLQPPRPAQNSHTIIVPDEDEDDEDGDNGESDGISVEAKKQELTAFLATILSILRSRDTSPLLNITKLVACRPGGRDAALNSFSSQPICVRAFCGDTPVTETAELSIIFTGDAFQWQLYGMLEVAVRTLASAHLQELVVGDPLFWMWQWAALERIPDLKLRSVEAWGCASLPFMELLTRQWEGASPPTSRRRRAPAGAQHAVRQDTGFLSTVRSVTIRWTPISRLSYPEDQLPQRLARRAALGAPIQSFHIDNTCSIRISTLRAIRAACPEMALTGIEFKPVKEDEDEKDEMPDVWSYLDDSDDGEEGDRDNDSSFDSDEDD
ncbi:hypothetical protein FA95DRAFT_1614032 [Auriscalpium vulgare]|uniref:Uncharacterized protein n=1 Tax=Auriscalpium vulgare TaxID=40419 RepID=A0ACB8R186_9AGAM|nr:hypothetical protein FA95DRAFT_1614032 [Auriscalpium vulgare]